MRRLGYNLKLELFGSLLQQDVEYLDALDTYEAPTPCTMLDINCIFGRIRGMLYNRRALMGTIRGTP